LVDELLDVSRIESGKLEFRVQPVDMPQLISEVASRMQLSTNQHTIEVELNGLTENPVNADRDHLEQVLDNLVSNAIKFSPDGGTILLGVREQGDSVVVSIRDPGVGIPEDQLDAVFGLFYQAEDPVSRRTGGMGLGLYISKEIISRHGGRIWAESEPGAGSTFNFSLPRAVSPRPSTPEPRQRRAATNRARR
jgi:signal transduction histidine kinase